MNTKENTQSQFNTYINIIQELTHLLSFEENAFGLCYEDVVLDIFERLGLTMKFNQLKSLMDDGLDCCILDTKAKYASLLARLYIREFGNELIPESLAEYNELAHKANTILERLFIYYTNNNKLVLASPWLAYSLNLRDTHIDFETFLKLNYWQENIYQEKNNPDEIIYATPSGSSYEFLALLTCNEPNKLSGRVIRIENYSVLTDDKLRVPKMPVIVDFENCDVDMTLLNILNYPK